jgi:hypothetical protein
MNDNNVAYYLGKYSRLDEASYVCVVCVCGVCVCVCVCARARARARVCVCVCGNSKDI